MRCGGYARGAAVALLLCCWPWPASADSADQAARTIDLAGIWRVEVDAVPRGGPLFCNLIPELHEVYLDTVATAGSLAELLRAVVPDSLGAAFDAWCELSTPSSGGDQARISCLLPLTLVAPCSLSVRFDLLARQHRTDSVTARGAGSGVLHGNPPCPGATCPGEIEVRLIRQVVPGNR